MDNVCYIFTLCVFISQIMTRKKTRPGKCWALNLKTQVWISAVTYQSNMKLRMSQNKCSSSSVSIQPLVGHYTIISHMMKPEVSGSKFDKVTKWCHQRLFFSSRYFLLSFWSFFSLLLSHIWWPFVLKLFSSWFQSRRLSQVQSSFSHILFFRAGKQEKGQNHRALLLH